MAIPQGLGALVQGFAQGSQTGLERAQRQRQLDAADAFRERSLEMQQQRLDLQRKMAENAQALQAEQVASRRVGQLGQILNTKNPKARNFLAKQWFSAISDGRIGEKSDAFKNFSSMLGALEDEDRAMAAAAVQAIQGQGSATEILTQLQGAVGNPDALMNLMGNILNMRKAQSDIALQGPRAELLEVQTEAARAGIGKTRAETAALADQAGVKGDFITFRLKNGTTQTVRRDSKAADRFAEAGATIVDDGDAAVFQKKIDALMATGLDRRVATGIVTGRFSVQTDPESGQSRVVDKADGSMIVATTKEVAQIAEAPTSPLSARTDTTLEAATGPVEQAFKRSINLLVGSLGVDDPFPDTTESATDLDSLNRDSMMLLSQGLGGRPSVFTQQQIRATLPQPGDTDTKAKSRVRSLLDMLSQKMSTAQRFSNDPAAPKKLRQAAEGQIGDLNRLLQRWSDFVRPAGQLSPGEIEELEQLRKEQGGG